MHTESNYAFSSYLCQPQRGIHAMDRNNAACRSAPSAGVTVGVEALVSLYLPQSCFSSLDTPRFPSPMHGSTIKGVCVPHFLLCLFNSALEWTCWSVHHVCFLHGRIWDEGGSCVNSGETRRLMTSVPVAQW